MPNVERVLLKAKLAFSQNLVVQEPFYTLGIFFSPYTKKMIRII